MPRVNYGLAQKFLDDALSYESDECLIWPFSVTGKRDRVGRSGGYGQLRINKKLVLAHNLICERAHGPRPTFLHQAAHECGTQRCINKRHLSWKTPEGNAADKHRHGRIGGLRGQQNPAARLSDSQVREIKAALAKGGPLGFQNELARKYGVSKVYISAVKTGKRWLHIK